MADSILTSTKEKLGIEATDETYNAEIMDHINSAFSTLTQLGVGPPDGFQITDVEATWDDYITSPALNPVKTYLGLKVRLVFDPPTTSFAIAAVEKQIEELEFRLNIQREATEWTPPQSIPPVDPEVIIIPSAQAWYAE